MNHPPEILGLHASIDGGPEQEFVGRFAWCLAELIKADYVFRLRRAGVDIETVGERHGGAYSGVHALYVLRSVVQVVRVVRESERHAA